ncbi:hypothetical protein QYE76_036296 [Lolium multiflorum]|uniref:Retrotransposon gag domain-containing protein n=1 Tax=Lolium multiflorum TaxID=4521 RepID=A0AAD8R0R3_LOLMU|nr:hypothetical protein QYE76_036296 [Lolium multiflorum]
MADGTPVTYEDLTEELKKKYDEVKAILEADLIGSFHRTRSHGIRWKGFSQGALDGVDLSAPSKERTRAQLCVGSELEKQAWLAKYATPANLQSSTPAASTADQISTILRDQFGMVPKRRTIGYSKPYPNEYELIPLPPKYRLPDFSKFNGSDGSSSIEHVSRYLAQLGTISAADELRVRFFAQSLTGSAFGWYTSLPPDSIRTWKQLEEQFHMQYHSEASEAGIADLAQVRQKRGETVAEYVQRFRLVRNRCYSARVTEKEAVELAVVGLASPIKDMASQADYPSLAHMVQKLSIYEQRHPDLYQDKFKRAVVLVEADEDEGSAGDQEVAVTEWTRGATPVSCKWVKPPGEAVKIPEGLKIPTVQELNGKPYCKWHNSFSHTTNDCRVWRQQIQMVIEQGRLIFNQYAMKVDTHPFPAVNMVEYTYPGGCQPRFSFNINMVGPGHHSGKDGDEGSCSRSKDTEEAVPRDRLRHDGKRYITEGEVRNVRYQRPLSDHLLNKYVSQYDQRRRPNDDDERDRLARDARRRRRHDRDEERYERHAKERLREQDDEDRHWDCPFFRHCWDSGMSRLPIGNCPECRQKRKDAANVSVFKRLGPLPPRNKHAESPRVEDLEDLEDDDEEEEDMYHRPRWCPDGLSRSQKHRVQRLRGLEEAERLYLHTLRKARPDLAAKIQRTLDEEGRPQKMEWRPKQRKANDETSAGTNMVFILPTEFSAPGLDEAPVAQLDCGPRPVIFKKPRERSYRHLKALYLRGRKTIPTTFFIVDSKSTYVVLLGRDWIHANCCIPSTMHQCIIQWDGDEVEVVHADDSTAGMNAWETAGQEPLSGINLDDCERIDVTKDGVRLVLSTGLTV